MVGTQIIISYLISTLFLTHLTVPSQLLETFRFYSVGYGFGSEEPTTFTIFSHVQLINKQKNLLLINLLVV